MNTEREAAGFPLRLGEGLLTRCGADGEERYAGKSWVRICEEAPGDERLLGITLPGAEFAAAPVWRETWGSDRARETGGRIVSGWQVTFTGQLARMTEAGIKWLGRDEPEEETLIWFGRTETGAAAIRLRRVRNRAGCVLKLLAEGTTAVLDLEAAEDPDAEDSMPYRLTAWRAEEGT